MIDRVPGRAGFSISGSKKKGFPGNRRYPRVSLGHLSAPGRPAPERPWALMSEESSAI